MLELTHAHIYFIFGTWIIKNSPELVEIWPKTFLYMYFVVNIPELWSFYVQLNDIIKIITTHITICTMWSYLFKIPNELQRNYKLQTAIQIYVLPFLPYLSQILTELLEILISLQRIKISIHICNLCKVICRLFCMINFTTKDQSKLVWTGFFFGSWTD